MKIQRVAVETSDYFLISRETKTEKSAATIELPRAVVSDLGQIRARYLAVGMNAVEPDRLGDLLHGFRQRARALIPCLTTLSRCHPVTRKAPSIAQVLNLTGRGRGTRTPDPRFWRPMLYQLSYTPRADAGRKGKTRRNQAVSAVQKSLSQSRISIWIRTTTASSPTKVQNAPDHSAPGMPARFTPMRPVRNPSGRKTTDTTDSR
jgi:hypothetical protein